MQPISPHECSRIAQDLQIRKVQVEAVVQLFDDGNTVPFITRYRKERTGGLNEEVIRQIQIRVQLLRQLHDRKQTILRTIENQGKLTAELRQAIQSADTTKRLEDLYLPYKPKKKSLAAAAREKGLDPVAQAIWYSDPTVAAFDELLPTLVNPEKALNTTDDVKLGVQHILAEMMAESAEIRHPVRTTLWATGKVGSVKSEKLPEGKGLEYKDYFEFSEPARDIPSHRVLAINRAEKEGAVKTRFEWDKDRVAAVALENLSAVLLQRVGKTPPVPQPPAPLAPPVSETPAEAPASEEAPAPVAEHVPQTEEVKPLVESIPVEPQIEMTGEVLAPGGEFRSPHVALLKTSLEDALNRLLLPSLEREIRGELTDEAEQHAIHVFARNLRSLLLQPPLRGKRIVAIDPAFRTGCKLAALDEFGNLLEHSVIYPFTPPPRKGKKDKPEAAKPAAENATVSVGEAPPPAADQSPASEGVTDSPPPLENAQPKQLPEGSDAPVSGEAIADAPAATASAAETVAVTQPTVEIPVDKKAEARSKFLEFILKNQAQIIALGNGTGCRETEELVAEVIGAGATDVSYVIVNEAGASHYSVSPVGREEFPSLDQTIRSTISIGRRLQDPLSELVKVDPQNIGVGLYQHDMGQKDLKESLDAVVESCVNQVGVDVNTASVPLLRHVSGLNQLVAREIVEYRQKNGPFTGRDQLRQVPNLGDKRYEQAAGFLKIPDAANPFDKTWIHPESYETTEKILTEVGASPSVIEDKSAQEDLHAKLKALNVEELSRKLNVGPMTVQDIVQALLRPGRDPREELPPPIFKKGILKLEDLSAGLELKGTVLNVVDFGVFVDIGLKESGLVHISRIANRYIKNPSDVVAVNDVVRVWVEKIDQERGRVSLTMIEPGTERKPQERRPAPPRNQGAPREGGNRPPRGRRPDGPGGPPQGQGQGSPQGQENRGPDPRGPRPEGRGRGPDPRGPRPPRSGGRPDQRSGAESRPQSPPPPPPPPRKPRREAPKPKLSTAALQGKEPLRTFGELSVFFTKPVDKPAVEQVKPPEPPPTPAAAETPPPPEQT